MASSDKRTYIGEYFYLGGGAYAPFQIDKIMNQLAINIKGPTKEEVKLGRQIMQGA